MHKILFDWKTASTTKKDVKPLFSTLYLFDGYLTEATSYPHFGQMAYLTRRSVAISKKYPKALFSGISLFNGYLTEY